MAKKSQIDIAIERVQAEIDILEAVMARLVVQQARTPAKRPRKAKVTELKTAQG